VSGAESAGGDGGDAPEEDLEAGQLVTDGAPDRGRSRSTRRRRMVKWGVSLVLLAWVAAAVVLGVRTRSSMLRGIDHLESARSGLSVESLIQGDQLSQLREASADFDSAAASSNHWLVDPFRVVPWLGRQIRSVQSLTNSAASVADLGVDASQRMRSVIGNGSIQPDQRAEVATQLGSIADEVNRSLSDLDLGPPKDLVRPLQSGRDDVVTAVASLGETLTDVGRGATGVAQFLQGPSRYLLLAAHNGEMRAGTGMFLSAGVVDVRSGSFDVAEMSSTTDLRLPPGAVTLPVDLDRLWGWTGPGQEWRNLAMSPEFPVTAALAADMWRAKTGASVDGVMVVDVAALRGLVNVVGSVQLSDRTITKDNVTDFVLVDQYRDIQRGGDFDEATGLRRDRLSELARAVVGGLDESDWKFSTMIDEMLKAIRGRHVLMWSSRASEQTAWAAAGADGALGPDSTMVSLLSQGGTKIDKWIDVRPVVRRTAGSTPGRDQVTVTVTLRNDTPTGLPSYVAGPSRRAGVDAGVDEGAYGGVVSFTLPGASTDIQLTGDPALVAGPDGPTQVIARRISLQRGETGTISVRFALPAGAPLEVVPSAKIPATTWDVDGIPVVERQSKVVGVR